MSTIPRELNYATIQPEGFPSQIFTTEFRPINFNNEANDSNVRFQINRDTGFWDPYSAYFEVEVDFSGADNGTQ